MSDDLLNFEEHRRRNESASRWRNDARDDGDPRESMVKCARCGELIPMNAKRCPMCEVHFSGEAWEFAHESESDEDEDTPASNWVTVVGVVMLAGLGLVLVFAKIQAMAK